MRHVMAQKSDEVRKWRVGFANRVGINDKRPNRFRFGLNIFSKLLLKPFC